MQTLHRPDCYVLLRVTREWRELLKPSEPSLAQIILVTSFSYTRTGLVASGRGDLWRWSGEGPAAASRVSLLLGLHGPQLSGLGSALSPQPGHANLCMGAVPGSMQGSQAGLLELAGQSCFCCWPPAPGNHDGFARGQSAGQPGRVWEGSRGSQPVCMADVMCQARLWVILLAPLGDTLAPLLPLQVHPPALPPGG